MPKRTKPAPTVTAGATAAPAPSAPAAPSDMLTREELCARWRDAVTPRTLDNWRVKGKGPAYTKMGRLVLYPLAGVLEYERANSVTPAPV